MKTICLYFQIHQPLRLKTYRFFSMGKDHNYLDEAANRSIMQKVARLCYLPMNELLLKTIKEQEGKFKVSFSISGTAIEQFRSYAPQVLASFKELAKTGCVEFLAETYSKTLSSLCDMDEFEKQVKMHSDLMKKEFGQKPTAFCNTALIFSDQIADKVSQMGYKTMLTEGAKHVLGWKSPNFIYAGGEDQKLHLLLRNYKLSDDIAFRFNDMSWNEWPLTAEKYVDLLNSEETPGEVVNIFMDYETFGERLAADSGIFDFMAALPSKALESGQLCFDTVTETSAKYQPVAILSSNYPMSWADEERDITAWLGNELQQEAFDKLYAQKDKIKAIANSDFDYTWDFLQAADHFYYMATKWFSTGDSMNYYNPYGSAYEAFINYMNVLSDFIIEIDKQKAKGPKKAKTSKAK